MVFNQYIRFILLLGVAYTGHSYGQSSTSSLRWFSETERAAAHLTRGVHPEVFKDPSALQAYLLEIANQVGWDKRTLPTLQLKHVHDLGHGPLLLRFDQVIDGKPVMPGQLALLLRRSDYAVLASSGRPVAKIEAIKFQGITEQSYGYVVERIKREFGQSDANTRTTQVVSLADGTHRYEVTRLSPLRQSLLHASAKPVFYNADGELVESYLIHATGLSQREGITPQFNIMAYVVSADGNKLLYSTNRKLDFAFNYKVYGQAALPDLAPFLNPFGYTNPHPNGAPTPGISFPYVPQQNITLDHHPIFINGDPWLQSNDQETVGNNVDAFFVIPPVVNGVWEYNQEDHVSYRSAQGDFRAQITAPHAFAYTYDPTQPSWRPLPGDTAVPVPAADPQLNAEIVQAFYVTNWLHDLYYVHGFTETAGNMQLNNYGRGGQQGDPLGVILGYGTYALPSLDGQPSNLHIDPAWDLSVLGHEHFHTVYSRLHNWFSDYSQYNQTAAMAEGWADFMGVLVSFNPQAIQLDPNITGAYAEGGYFIRLYKPSRAPGIRLVGDADFDPYYYGTRRYPYSSDFTKNPLTFRHIEHLAVVPTIPPYFNWQGRANFNNEAHTAGEIWANALWGCFASMVRNYGVDVARGRMLDYVIPSIQLEPLHPTYLEARNALLAVIQASSQTDYLTCRSSFAQRGMGAGAVAPARESMELHGVKESFSTADAALSITNSALNESVAGDGILDVNETGQLTLTVLNSGFIALNDVHVDVATNDAITFPSGASVQLPAIAIGQSLSINIPVHLVTASQHQQVHFAVQLNSASHGSVGSGSAAAYVNYDWVRHVSSTNFVVDRAPEDWNIQRLASYDYQSEGCWKHTTNGMAGYFAAAEVFGGFRCALVSPWLSIPATGGWSLQLDHAFDFQNRGVGWIEFSSDGITWTDLEAVLGSSVYPGTYTNNYGANPGEVLRGFIGASAGYPASQGITFNFSNQFAGQIIKIRFVSDFKPSYTPYTGGWFLHNVNFTGLTQPIFHEVVSDRFDWLFRDGFDIPN